MVTRTKCMVCQEGVWVMNCYYQCKNCGFEAH